MPTTYPAAAPEDVISTYSAMLARLGRRAKLMIGGLTGWADEGFAFAESEVAPESNKSLLAP